MVDAGEHQGDADEIPRAYVRLGLRLGRVVPGLVDAHLGDPDVARRVDAEPRPDPGMLRGDAAALRRRLLVERPVAPVRREYLDAQLRACEVIAARAAGEQVVVVEEIRRCLGVEVAPGDHDRYRAAHGRLAEVLGVGVGALPEALADFRRRDLAPTDRLHDGVAALVAALRERTAATIGLPAGERVDLTVVGGEPWAGFARRIGPGRSSMRVSRDAGHRMGHLALLAAHEAYPGHHTEMVRTELAPTRPDPERTLLLARTPQSLVAEGVAELGLAAVVGTGWGAWAGERLAEAGLPTDATSGALGEAVEDAMAPLAAVRQDAALLLHADRGADREERALAHLRRWLLVDEARARRMLEFLTHPRWRIHTTTYVEGTRLVGAWLGGRREDGPAARRYARLLDEVWTPDRLRRDTPETTGSPARGTDLHAEPPGRGERYPRHAEDTPMSPLV